jgi:hypothetical protein
VNRPSRAGLWALALAAAAQAQTPFAIVALPDTQNYSNSEANAPLFTQQTQWIADQILVEGNPRNIAFVTHLGDVVSEGASITQWNRADASMGVLETGPDGVVPYGVLPGNHDFATTSNKSTGTANYVSFFGPARFAGRGWYGGADPSGNNSFQLFDGGGVQYLHIALEWRPSVNVTNGPERDPSPIGWAQDIIRRFPGVPTIISTHEHVDDDPPGRSSAGEALWNRLVRRNDQVIMVLNGHFHSLSVGSGNDGEYHQVSQNDFGKDVIEVLSDYQDYPNGGDGWLRIMTIDPTSDEIRFETYSPVLDRFQTETVAQVGAFASQFTIPLDFATRFDFEPPPDPPVPPVEVFESAVFAEGVGGYAGTLDKEIRSAGGDGANGDNTEISVDGDDGSPGLRPTHGLIWFPGIIGGGPGQIAPGVDIAGAELRLNITNPGSGFDLHRMTATWDEGTTWAGLGGDGITPGVEATSEALVRVGTDINEEVVPVGTLEVGVTGIVEDWIAGETNHGLGLVALPSGLNGLDFTSSESGAPPALVVRTLRPNIVAYSFREAADGYAGTTDTQLREGAPARDESSAPVLSADTEEDGGANHVLIRFGDLFGAGPGRVPPDASIARAILTVHALDPGDGAAVHRLLLPFAETDTWSGSFGGDGVQADDAEASASFDDLPGGATGDLGIEVTPSVRAWQADPGANHGWVLLPLGPNGWDLASSENTNASRRPTLAVYVDLCPIDLVSPYDAGADALDVQELVDRVAGGSPPGDWNGDGVVDFLDVAAYLNDAEAGCGP